jgi:hypothetical protein
MAQQTDPLMAAKITLPVVATVAGDVEAHTLADCGHFITEERPRFIIDHILKLSACVAGRSAPRKFAL